MPGQSPNETFDLSRLNRQAVVRFGPGKRRRAFDHVKPVHLVLPLPQSPSGSEFPRVPKACRTGSEKVAVQRQNDSGIFEMILSIDKFTKREKRSLDHIVAVSRFVLVPFGRRKFLQQSIYLLGQGRRGNAFCEHSQPCSLALPLRAQSLAQVAQKSAPGTYFSQMGERLGTVWIVKREHRGLCEHIGCSQTGRVVGIALDFSRSSHMTFNQDTLGDSSQRHGRGEKQRLAWYNLFGRPNVGHDGLFGLARASGQTCQRQRCSH